MKLPLTNQGLSLIEAIVAIGIFIIIVVSWNIIVIQSYRTTSFGDDQQTAIREAREAIAVMVQEIREMSTAENGAYALEQADDNEIIFYSDVDSDVLTERIRYFLNGTQLQKGITEPSGDPLEYVTSTEIITTVADYVYNQSNNIFTYYDGTYPYSTSTNPLPAPARLISTKLIHVQLFITVDLNKAPETFVVESDVQLRNLKTNL